jgi:hypothetical protein
VGIIVIESMGSGPPHADRGCLHVLRAGHGDRLGALKEESSLQRPSS